MRRHLGFTLTELIAVIVILGILAVVALPRLNTSDYQAFAFREQVVATLRYAQKTAVSHRRLVCVAFTANSVSLTIARDNGAASCQYDLPLATGAAGLTSAAASFAATPAALFVQPDGRITADGAGTTLAPAAISITGADSISVVGASGHVG